MNAVCCPGCALRFSSATAVYLDACPLCYEPLRSVQRREDVMGFRLMTAADLAEAPPVAVAVALPLPAPPEPPRIR